MIENLQEYFLPEQEYYLNEIKYNRIETGTNQDATSAICEDGIYTELNGTNGIKIIVTRKFYFEPEQIFSLNISFGAELQLNPDKADEINWKEINLSEEFRESGEFVTSNLMSRIALLCAQITSSYGQQPLILPPGVIKNE